MTEETKAQEETTIFINPKNKRLLSLANAAGALSWLLVAISIIQILFELFLRITNQATPGMWADPASLAIIFSSKLSEIIRATFYFFILQTMKETLLLIIDISEERSEAGIEENDAPQP